MRKQSESSYSNRRIDRRVVLVLTAGVVAAAAVALIGPLSQTIKELTLPLRHEDVIRREAQAKDIDSALLAAVIYSESKFRPRKSKAGAIGLMQILPDTAKFVARKSGDSGFELEDLASPQINIAYGSWYLRYLNIHYGGDEVLALAAYNAGEHNVDSWRADALRHGEDVSDPARIPFPETREYVRRVLSTRGQYRKKYAAELGYR